MKRTHENIDEGDDSDSKDKGQEEGSIQKSVGENDPVPVDEEADFEEFPTDLEILIKLRDYCELHKAYPREIDGGYGLITFGLQFGGTIIRPTILGNRTMELELEYLKMAGKPESSFVLPEDKQKFSLSKSIWHRKYGDIDQIADIEFLKNIFDCSTKKEAIPSGKNVAKRIKMLQNKYLGNLKTENGIAKYSMSAEDEEFFRLSSIIWEENADGSGQVSAQEPLSADRSLQAVRDIEILKCMIDYYAKNMAYPFNYSHLTSICTHFLHIEVLHVFELSERVAGLLWKYMVSSYDQELFKWSRMLWGDTLGETCNQDSTEETSSGGEEDESPKS